MSNGAPQFVEISASNLDEEHICCAIAGKQHQEGVDRKKAFLAAGFEKGLVFRKLDVRGKVFVEYAPAEEAQHAASPFGTFGAFLHGRLITHELMSPNKFRKLLENVLGD